LTKSQEPDQEEHLKMQGSRSTTSQGRRWKLQRRSSL